MRKSREIGSGHAAALLSFQAVIPLRHGSTGMIVTTGLAGDHFHRNHRGPGDQGDRARRSGRGTRGTGDHAGAQEVAVL